VSITGPTVADNYPGPAELNVFQDNVYGTFMFGAIPPTTFAMAVSPNSQNVAEGSCVDYSVVVQAKGDMSVGLIGSVIPVTG